MTIVNQFTSISFARFADRILVEVNRLNHLDFHDISPKPGGSASSDFKEQNLDETTIVDCGFKREEETGVSS
jgi:hypothetical protein